MKRLYSFLVFFSHPCTEHRCPRRCSVGGLRGSLSECRPARLSALAGYGEAMRRGTGTLRMGDAVRHRHCLHLHWRACYDMGTGEKDPEKGLEFILECLSEILIFCLLRSHFSSSSL